MCSLQVARLVTAELREGPSARAPGLRITYAASAARASSDVWASSDVNARHSPAGWTCTQCDDVINVASAVQLGVPCFMFYIAVHHMCGQCAHGVCCVAVVFGNE